MNYKVLLLDFDGVISPGRRFSEIYNEEFGVDIEILLPIFKDEKPSANLDKTDFKESLKGVLKEWEWKGTVDELMDYWMNADSDIDQRVVKLVKQTRKKGVKVYLATDQEKHRTNFIWNKRGLKDWMDGRFVSYEIGFTKKDPKFFKHIINKLKVKPNEILFFDDSESKVASAKKLGIDAHLYANFDVFESYIKSGL